ncbi:ABC transporter permease [Halanaerobiaceae bacterium Z-7014]|uniref:ABC transporter permease n=1 Tax=Halonatronomonas betaini TaxID=2778430 RepID=A0A931AWX0_9FIRM|nr:ABC transporter permease [Halonatronomonas betaini]MBF8436298.1 ABC transporter permease [Halonatronomonas betaini]
MTSDILAVIFNLNTFNAALRLSIPLALGAMAGAFSERAGIINIGLEGMLLMGAFAGVFGSFVTGSAWLGVGFAAVAGILTSLIFAIFIIEFKADHVVAGVGLNILALGFTTWMMQMIWGTRGASPSVASVPAIVIYFLEDIPVIGRLLGIQSPFVYIMLAMILAGWVLMFKTPLGLRIRFTGEHPEAADSQGINVKKIKYFSLLLSGFFCGVGGAYLSLGHLSQFSRNMTAGRGYMALAANIFGQWNPLGGLAASLLFGFTDAMQMRLQGIDIGLANDLIQMLPYVLTIAVLAGAVIKSRPPAALGNHYESGE